MTNFATMVRDLLRGTRFYPLLNALSDELSYRNWIKAGKPVPSPHLVKQRAVKEFAKRFRARVFVETGTSTGDMVYAVREIFDVIYSIERDTDLCRDAQKRLAEQRNVLIFQGDSGDVLGEILATIRQPCLLWLDAHCAAGDSAADFQETPVKRELRHVSRHPLKRTHVILINDARLLTGEGDFPSIQFLRDWAAREGFDSFEVRDDIVRIYNSGAVASGGS